MKIKRVPLFYLLLLLYFCPAFLFAQDSTLAGSSPSGSLRDSMDHYLKPQALIIPGTFLIYGGLKPVISGIGRLDDHILSRIREDHPHFHTDAADYLTWAPSASVFLMDAFQTRTVHHFRDHLIIEAGSIVITGGIGYGMRLISRNMSAYNTQGTKFPSGHTANAFRGAEIFHQELKKIHPVLSYSAYLAAGAVGLLRLYNQNHLLTEVIAGAGLGILSTKLTYWVFEKIAGRKR